jgi:hypothetical protein
MVLASLPTLQPMQQGKILNFESMFTFFLLHGQCKRPLCSVVKVNSVAIDTYLYVMPPHSIVLSLWPKSRNVPYVG